VVRDLKQAGYTIIMVEQNFHFAAPLADRMYIIEHGTIVAEIGKHELKDKQDLLHKYLEV
jgi:branched-chain amino acid transport system ATP-binding protein